ncbi:MAG: hypothetical protein Q8Q32_03295 [bacterium]|nr:hypothetical protein [bacterium]
MENFQNPENQKQEKLAVLRKIKQRLEVLGGGRRIVLIPEGINILIEGDRITVFESIDDQYLLEEILAFPKTDEDDSSPFVSYDARFYGTGEINEKDLEILEQVGKEKGVTRNDDSPVTLIALKRIQKYIES